VSFDVKEGEIFGIAGVAGNGQSELMNLLTGEGIDGVSGSLIYNSIDIKNFNPKKREICQLLLFQRTDLVTVQFQN
ncbi:MAG: ATP-binding cassette domain-containing protein, partial [Flavobacterium sp.]|nr:ATP-binding cassette domain-containing protein [Flavobacterium sp.]